MRRSFCFYWFSWQHSLLQLSLFVIILEQMSNYIHVCENLYKALSFLRYTASTGVSKLGICFLCRLLSRLADIKRVHTSSLFLISTMYISWYLHSRRFALCFGRYVVAYMSEAEHAPSCKSCGRPCSKTHKLIASLRLLYYIANAPYIRRHKFVFFAKFIYYRRCARAH